MGNCILTRRGGGAWVGIPNFTYTGTYETVDDGDGNWRIKFLTSGIFTLLKPKRLLIDVFCVGGGGGGGSTNGGGGGYTTTQHAITIEKDTPYQITIGAAGKGNVLRDETDGGATSCFETTANGGFSGTSGNGGPNMMNGGSGGGAYDYTPQRRGYGGDGGTDGENGGSGRLSGSSGGVGQGTTTREFGEPNGQLYSGGGGGGGPSSGGTGGSPGGGNGTNSGSAIGENATYYGCGGGGSPGNDGGNGYQGIAIIRNAREAAL